MTKMVKTLIQLGADVNAQNAEGKYLDKFVLNTCNIVIVYWLGYPSLLGIIYCHLFLSVSVSLCISVSPLSIFLTLPNLA